MSLPEFYKLEYSEGCRYCKNQTWLADERGAAHPCCILWIEQMGSKTCIACRASEAMQNSWRG